MSFSLLPDDRELTPDADLEAAAAGALALPEGVQPVADAGPAPFGKSWQFNFETGRFVRSGLSPATTHGFSTLEQWCLMAVHSTRFAHAVFTDEFGMEDPDEPLGEFAVGEILADWQRHLTEALLVHDRITAVENIDLAWDPSRGLLVINNFDVVTDEEDRISLSDIAVERSVP